MTSRQSLSNNRLRKIVKCILDALELGATVITHILAKTLSNGRRSVSPRTISNFLKERDDFVSIERCKWMKVDVCNH